MKKRVLAILAAATMAATTFTVPVFAESERTCNTYLLGMGFVLLSAGN